MFPSSIVDLISKVSPFLGSALGGPIGSVVGSLISTALGGIDMKDTDKVKEALEDPAAEQKLKELELEIQDIQNARIEASKDQGYLKLVRPMLALASMLAIMADIFAIQYVDDGLLSQVLVVLLIVLVWDIRQIYSFYFGKGEDVPSFLLEKFSKKK